MNSICVIANRELAAVPAPIGPSGLAAALGKDLVVQQRTLVAMRRLVPPRHGAAQIQAGLLNPFATAISQQQTMLPLVEKAVTTGDTVPLAALHTRFDLISHPPAVAIFVRDWQITACQRFEYFRA